MDEYMTGQAFPSPLAWALGAGLVLLVGWLIERSSKRAARRSALTSSPPTQASFTDDERGGYEIMRAAWKDITGENGAHVVSSQLRPDQLALRVWENDFVFSEVTRTPEGWIALLNVKVTGTVNPRFAERLTVPADASPREVVDAFFVAIGEEAGSGLDW